MADTRDLKSLALKGVRVRVSLAAPNTKFSFFKKASCFFIAVEKTFSV